MLKLPFKIGSAEGHLNMASAIETSNAFCNNNAFIVYATKLRSVEIQMFVLKGDHIGAVFTLQLAPEMPATAAHLSHFWHCDKQQTKLITDKTPLFHWSYTR